MGREQTKQKFKNTQHLETEKVETKLSHSDMAGENSFSEQSTITDEIIDYIIDGGYKKHIKTHKNNQVTMDISILNKMFYNTYKHFEKKCDTVECFSAILDVFDFEYSYFFNNLSRTIRDKLKDDFKLRTNIDLDKNARSEGLIPMANLGIKPKHNL